MVPDSKVSKQDNIVLVRGKGDTIHDYIMTMHRFGVGFLSEIDLEYLDWLIE